MPSKGQLSGDTEYACTCNDESVFNDGKNCERMYLSVSITLLFINNVYFRSYRDVMVLSSYCSITLRPVHQNCCLPSIKKSVHFCTLDRPAT